jgi:hypothetical protein
MEDIMSRIDEVRTMETEIKVGAKFVNKNNGGQEITVTDTAFQGMKGVIAYELHDAFRFNSLEYSSCDLDSFKKTFSDKGGKGDE